MPSVESILHNGTREESDSVLKQNIAAGKRVGDLVATTLGPHGMDKVIYPRDEHENGEPEYFQITNSGAYILKQISFESPTAKVVARVAAQDDQCGDGTTTTAVYAGQILDEVEHLLDKGFHPSTIIDGITEAVSLMDEAITDNAIKVSRNDRETLEAVIQTTMNGKMGEAVADDLCEWLLDAIERDDFNLPPDSIQTESLRARSLSGTEFVNGMVLKKSFAGNYQPTSLNDVRIALSRQAVARAQQLRQRVEHDEAENSQTVTYDAVDPDTVQAFTEREMDIMHEKVQPLLDADVDVLLVGNRVEDRMVDYLNNKDIAVVRECDSKRLDMLAAATGATAHTALSEFESSDIGMVGQVDQRSYQDIEQNAIFLRNPANGGLVSVLVHGSTWMSGWEVERNVNNAIAAVRTVLDDGYVIPGGGAIEIAVARYLRDHARGYDGREAIVIETLANVVEAVPKILARSAGMDSLDTIVDLRAAHHKGETDNGVLAKEAKTGSALAAGILEPAENKRSAIKAAAGVTSTILRIDDIITGIDAEVAA